MGERGLKITIEGDCGSFLWSIGDVMILNWMWLRGRNVYVTLKKENESMEANNTFVIIMENG
jgi:hypothetical protein